MKIFSLMVRIVTKQLSTTVILSPQVTPVVHPSTIEKGKRPLIYLSNSSTMLKIIIWNTRGVNSASFLRQCQAMVNIHRPTMLVLLETKMKENKTLCDALGFDLHIQSSDVGLSYGIAVMWKEILFHLDNFTVSDQGIRVMIKVLLDNSP